MNFDLKFLDNEWIAVAIALFVALYGIALSRIELPGYIRNLFNNNIFRIVFLSLLLVQSFDKAPHVALSIALVFVLTMYYLGEQEIKENFAYLESFRAQLKNKN